MNFAELTKFTSVTKYRLELRSDPSGAEVFTLDGEKIGTTPLALEAEKLEKLSRDKTAAFRIEAAGYVPGIYFFELHGEDVHDLKLVKFDENYFAKRLLRDYAPEANDLVRRILRIQALVLAKRYDEAEKLIDEFQKDHPNVAASYALRANIAFTRGKPDQAWKNLATAYSIDPSDPMIARALGREARPDRAPGARK